MSYDVKSYANLALHNSSHPTQAHSIIDKDHDNNHFVDEARLQNLIVLYIWKCLFLDSIVFTQMRELETKWYWNSLNIKTNQVFTKLLSPVQ